MYDKTKKVTDEEVLEEKTDKNESTKLQVKIYESQDGFEEKEKIQEDD